ncbi:Hint domain-containing protein [Maritimibacter sp. DP1N21-5]|uniref:Hint domain-containing protein n=1 Tax=Maritimibacter sp. DP1N21-5 TaxID=2836867 RepID=UPI001C448D43|nr:Hint domain-containing protein [Maritimibacter sp. DP1N21-5]MBV7409196.1 Hint domain-containing protein [Maritimibacter sp. DP1N21-5]
MSDVDITVTPYDGALLAANLLSSAQTIVLGAFGPSELGTLSDLDGFLSDADDGSTTFNGAPINYIGSGTATPGVNVLGLTVPLGTPRDLVVFEAAGQIYFHFPEGPPAATGMIALVVDIDATPYEVFTPLCFAAGTMIATPKGERRIERLDAGDLVLDVEGEAHEILWRGHRSLTIPEGPLHEKWLPVRIRAHALGPNVPSRDTRLSQQHRVFLSHPILEHLAGVEAGFARAVHLVNDRSVRLCRGRREVDYHHILCAEHVALLANNLPAASLLLAAGGLAEEGEMWGDEAQSLPPELLLDSLSGMAPCAPLLKREVTEELTQLLANRSTVLPVLSGRAEGGPRTPPFPQGAGHA